MMNTLLRIEEFGIFGLSLFLFLQTGFDWWWFPVLLLAPDISILGYWIKPKIGAFVYNFFHHKALAVVVYIAGYAFSISALALAGTVLLAHAAMDRMFGFGLKYSDSFRHTHLGEIGQA